MNMTQSESFEELLKFENMTNQEKSDYHYNQVFEAQDKIESIADEIVAKFGNDLPVCGNDRHPMWAMTYGMPTICRTVCMQLAINKSKLI